MNTNLNCVKLKERNTADKTMFKKDFIITEKNADEYIVKIGAFIKGQVDTANRKGVVLGMSGGIDCSVAAALCHAAKVPALLVMLPDGKDMQRTKSMQHAMLLIEKFGFEHRTIDIGKICKGCETAAGELSDLSKMNIRPRVRMTVLYSLAQTMQRFVLGTGNLSERLIGYFTKWGDGASDLNPLGMLTKNEVRILARALSVPREIVEKPPSAGLYDGQTDETELGITYAQIDAYALTGASGDASVDEKIENRINMSLHKHNPIPVFKG